MAVFVVPAMEEEPWPTLGPQVCDWIRSFLVFGPGDLLGMPAVLDDETEALIYRTYEVHPQFLFRTLPGGDIAKDVHPEAGRRRFKRVCWSLCKGSAKTEKGSWVAAAELHPEGPVRCDGFDGRGEPVGRGVNDPYIPMMAYTEEQTEELGYAVLKAVLEESVLYRDFDIGLERILRKDGHGRAVAVASSPNSNDGRLTTFQYFDETHRLVLPRQRRAHQTMLMNIPKRRAADAWTLETTTAYSPGEGSVAEATHDFARMVGDGKVKEPRLFFFHRQASDGYDLTDRESVKSAVLEALGPTAPWQDVEARTDLAFDPDTDLAYYERVILNRPRQTSMQAFNVEKWRALAVCRCGHLRASHRQEAGAGCSEGACTCGEFEGYRPPRGAQITLGFDGSRYEDSTGVTGTELTTGIQFQVGKWERPANATADWEVPVSEVMEVFGDAFTQWDVWRLYGDPFFWETQLSELAGRFGDKHVVEWRTNRWGPMAYAVREFTTAIEAGEVRNDGDADVTRHIGNARKMILNLRDDKGERLHVITKERSDSPFKMDFAMSSVLSWTARNDAIAAGAVKGPSVYEERGFRRL